MSRSVQKSTSVDGRTRCLSYALVGFCTVAILFGPLVAEAGLNCCGFSGLIASLVTPWLNAPPPVATTFVLLEQFWVLLILWVGLIALSRWQAQRKVSAPTSSAPDWPSQKADWVETKQAEQRLEHQSLIQQLIAKGPLWGAIGMTWWALLGGFVVFCIAFGTPWFGGILAESLLQALGCNHLDCASPLGEFWTARLAPYQLPLYGWLSSPLWLFTQFHGLLLAWLALIFALGLLPIYRFGWWSLVNQRLWPLLRGLFAVFLIAAATMACTLIFGDLAPLPTPRSGGWGGGIIEMVIAVQVILVALAGVLLAALIGFIILVIAWTRRISAARDP